jgi:hypothetical protein
VRHLYYVEDYVPRFLVRVLIGFARKHDFVAFASARWDVEFEKLGYFNNAGAATLFATVLFLEDRTGPVAICAFGFVLSHQSTAEGNEATDDTFATLVQRL